MQLLETINQFVWGVPALIAILSAGIYLSVLTGFVQFRYFPKAMKRFCSMLTSGGKKQNSQLTALCTALAATVGTGNIIGVAGAITIGGPGAIFWMWICGFLGMGIKFAEATLAVRFRTENKCGEYMGGPMYMIKNGLGSKWHWLAAVYCILGIAASFGVGNATQINACVSGVNTILASAGVQNGYWLNAVIGLGLAGVVAWVLLGGGKRIGDTAQKLVPIAAAGYILLCVICLCVNYSSIPKAIHLIVYGAFSPKAVTGGVLGSVFCALRIGAARGTFTNEAGMGTASIAHASASVDHPVEQGLVGIIEVFVDTICICTLTALVVLCSGIGIVFGVEADAFLTAKSFSHSLGTWTQIPLSLAICCFGIATVFGWSLYGGRCAQYLFGEKSWKIYVMIQTIVTALAAVLKTETVWLLSEILNGLMVLPNLTALILLSPELLRLIKGYCSGNNLTKGTF